MAAKYGTFTVPKLKFELAKRGAVTRGRKEALVERLESYDRNNNFQGPIIAVPEEFKFSWPKSDFHQLSQGHKILFPKIQREQVNEYFRYRIAADGLCADDVKAVEKGEKLFQASKVLACSFNRTESSIFFTGMVGAAMKKDLAYSYRLRIDAKTGEVLNSDCECPAGKGPHGTCKHLAAVLLVLTHFAVTGDVQIEKSCTENLQQFHAPKRKYEGSPVKAEDMGINAKKKCNFDDPRPQEYRNMPGYHDHVRNTVINFCSMSSFDMPMRYLYPKADIQVAAEDHDYLDIPFLHYWVDTANKIDQEKAYDIEKKTRGQRLSKYWYEERSWRITSSRFGEICKMTNRRNKNKLCQSLTEHKVLTVPSVLHGRKYEGKAIRNFEEIYINLKVSKACLFVRPEYAYLGASPDGVIDKDSIVEIKCAYTGRDCDILPGKMFSYLELDANNKIRLKRTSNYYMQIQGQLFLSQRSYCYFIIYTFKDFFVEKIALDSEYFEFSILPKITLFYNKYFRKYIADNM